MYGRFTVSVNILCKPPMSVVALNSSNCKLTLQTLQGPSCECNMWQVPAPGLGCCPSELCPANTAQAPGYLTETYLAACSLPAPQRTTVAVGIRGHAWGKALKGPLLEPTIMLLGTSRLH
jgi:hypothetical protein